MSRILEEKWMLLPLGGVLASCALLRGNSGMMRRRLLEAAGVALCNPALNAMVESGVPAAQIVGVAGAIVIYPLLNYGMVVRNLVVDGWILREKRVD